MIAKIYTLWDNVAKTSSGLYLARNDDDFSRQMKMALKDVPFKNDFIMVDVGCFNTDTCELTGNKNVDGSFGRFFYSPDKEVEHTSEKDDE